MQIGCLILFKLVRTLRRVRDEKKFVQSWKTRCVVRETLFFNRRFDVKLFTTWWNFSEKKIFVAKTYLCVFFFWSGVESNPFSPFGRPMWIGDKDRTHIGRYFKAVQVLTEGRRFYKCRYQSVSEDARCCRCLNGNCGTFVDRTLLFATAYVHYQLSSNLVGLRKAED